jgi:hypothetical protein
MTPALRLLAGAVLAITALMALAPGAMAADGVGLWGRTDDKVVTYAGFILIVFFTVLVIGLSYIQGRLESRRERIQEDLDRLGPRP